MPKIHPQAVVDSGAELAEDVSVGPFAYVGENVKVDSGTIIDNHASLTGFTTVGKNCRIHPSAVVGNMPQDLKYKGEKTTLDIGDNTVVREFCSLHTGTELGGGKTVIGSNCLLMAYSHVAHDCLLGDHVIMANGVQLAGHVHIHDGARLSGLAAVHHFVRIGTCAFVAGMARLSIDVPPYTLAAGYPARIRGLNIEGLKRRSMSPEALKALRECYKLCYREGISKEKAFETIEADSSMDYPEVKLFVKFLRETGLGKHGRAQEGTRTEVPPEERDGTLSFRLTDTAIFGGEAEAATRKDTRESFRGTAINPDDIKDEE